MSRPTPLLDPLPPFAYADPLVTVQHPLAPLVGRGGVLLVDAVDENGAWCKQVHWPSLGWSVIGPSELLANSPGAAAADVLAALLHLRRRQHGDGPESDNDGTVRFSPWQLQRLMGWGCPDRAPVNDNVVGTKRRPSSRHYARLRHALAYLAAVQFVRDGRSAASTGSVTRRAAASTRFRVLAAPPDLREEPRGRKGPRSAPPASSVQFSGAFLNVLRTEASAATWVDHARLASLPPTGQARLLYRLLRASHRGGQVDIALSDLMARLGYTDASAVPPHVAERRLADDHRALIDAGVLTSMPLLARQLSADGTAERRVIYALQPEPKDGLPALSGEAFEAARAAISYGVVKTTAYKLAGEDLPALVAALNEVRRKEAGGKADALDNVGGFIVWSTRGKQPRKDAA